MNNENIENNIKELQNVIRQWQAEYQKAMDLAASEAILKAGAVIENGKLQAENLKLKELVELAYIPIFDLPRNKHTQDWVDRAKELIK